MKDKYTVIFSIILFTMLFLGCDSDKLNNYDKAKTTIDDTTMKEDKATPDTISKHSDNKSKHTWKSQDDLIEFVCDGEYGVEGWGIYNGYYNYHNRKYKLNIEISEYYNHTIEFYYDANRKGVNYDVSDGEALEMGTCFLFGDIKHIDEKTFSVTVDGSGSNSENNKEIPFETPYNYGEEIIFKMIN